MNDDFHLDLSDVERDILAAEVLCVYFPLLRKTLLVDSRFDLKNAPLVRILPMAKDFDERIRTIQKLRPSFPPPKNIVVVPWNKYPDSLVALGVWDAIRRRCESTGYDRALEDLDGALSALKMLQEKEVLAAVRGEGQYETLWKAGGGQP
jgi:hypothetical protein